jgi:O-antigen/teichoic acid export membrane protein
MVYFDRFVLGAMVSTAAIAVYAVPFSLATRLAVIPNGVAGVLFPELSAMAGDGRRATRLYGKALKYLFIVYFPLILALCLFAHELLALWINAEFARQAAPVLQILALGLFVNGLAQIPYILLLSAGRPDVPAKFHLAELPLYLALLWVLIGAFGVVGAACAWSLRALADAAVLFFAAGRFHALADAPLRRGLAWLAAAVALCIAAALLAGLEAKLLFAILVTSGFAVAAWFQLMTGEEQSVALQSVRRLRRLA